MVTYLIRRIVAAIVLLFVVSVITFSIFYLVPRFAGATPESLATRYVGRTADVETVQLTAERLGFYDPIWVQYGRWAKGIVAGAEYECLRAVPCADCRGARARPQRAGDLAGPGR